ncbi:cytochrome c oxidase assembly protein [Mycolicibacterium mengxianglii]|uniref:cytochrome c oxidase assembly protein n=1 Tax=Mycolicibacterium mengxianglii TaxID=2736649 RepID=UPI0018D167DC|nr:cytochrome c oxidase assembly protein [Mycolicibacterium mengxianglii]
MPHHHSDVNALPVIVAVAAVVLAAAYLVAAYWLRGRGDTWSRWYDASFVAGCAAIVVAVLPLPVAMFTAHMVTHLMTGMVAPLLLVLGRPITLVLRALRPGSVRRAVVAVAHSVPVGVLVAPPVAAILDLGGLWVLYRTSLFSAMHHQPALSAVVHLHVFAAGVLFSFAICQVDPTRRRYGFGLRATTLLLAGAAHAVLAKGLYGFPPPGSDIALPDLHAGAQVMYYGGDVVEIALATVLAVQWYVAVGRSRARVARRADYPVAGS